MWDASLLVTVGTKKCLDMTVGKIENGSERGFVKHRLNCLLITDPICLENPYGALVLILININYYSKENLWQQCRCIL